MKKLTLLSILLFLLINNTANSQSWNKHGIGATAAGVCIVDISVPNDNVAWGILSVFSAGTCGGQVPYVSRTLNGNSWMTLPITLAPDVTPVCISAISSTTAWIAASNIASNTTGEIYKTINSGVTWTYQPTADFRDAVRFIHFYDANEGVAVGDSSVYITSDGGTTWSFKGALPVPSSIIGTGTTVFLLNSYEVLDNSIWLGDSWGFFYKSTDRGLTWTCMPNSIFPSAIKGIAFRDPNYGIAVAAQYVGGGSAGPGGYADHSVFTTDGGVTWNPMVVNFSPSPNVSNGEAKYDVAYVPGTANTFVITSEYSPSYAAFSCISNDGGLNWSLLDSTEQHTACVFTSPTNGYTGGYINSFSEGVYRWVGNLPTSLNEKEGIKKLALYPNPVNDILHVNIKGFSSQCAIRILDISGKEVMRETISTFNEEEIEVNVASLAKGIYMICIEQGNVQIANNKFVR